jgi:hypothetical protein
MLVRHGWLIFGSATDREDFLTIVRALPQEVRKLWATALPSLLVAVARPPSRALSEVENGEELAEHWSRRIEVALLGGRKAEGLGLAKEDVTFREPISGVEVARIEFVREALLFREALALAESDIPRDIDRRRVWDERFRVLATATKTVTILDRYAVMALLDGRGDGLRWFLQRLDECGTTNVHLIAQVASARQVGAAEQALVSVKSDLATGGVKSLSVTLASNAGFRDEAHSRHVRLGPVSVLIDRGLSTFDERKCGQSTPCRPCSRSSALERERRVERRSLRGARRRVIWG